MTTFTMVELLVVFDSDRDGLFRKMGQSEHSLL